MNNTVSEIVLVVDCQDSNYYQLSVELETMDFKVTAIDGGINAINAAIFLQPDIILMDISHTGYIESESEFQTQNISLVAIALPTQRLARSQRGNWKSVDYIIKPARIPEILTQITTRIALRQIDSRLQQEILQRRQTEAFLLHSQRLWQHTSNGENELSNFQPETAGDFQNAFTEEELAEFADIIACDLQDFIDSLSTFLQPPNTKESINPEELECLKCLSDRHSQLQMLIHDLFLYANPDER